MTAQDYQNKANEINAKNPHLKAEVRTSFGGILEIKVINSDKAKTLKEIYQKFNFSF